FSRSQAVLLFVVVCFFLRIWRPPGSPLFPYTTLFRSVGSGRSAGASPERRSGFTTVGRRTWPSPTGSWRPWRGSSAATGCSSCRSEEHTSELQSLAYLVCRLLLEKKKKKQ